MRLIKKIIFLFAIVPFAVIAQKPTPINPFLVHSNSPIAFDKVNATVIKDAVSSVIALSDKRVKTIAAVPASQKNIANTLMAFDELGYDLGDVSAKIGLVAATYKDDATRNAANDENQKLSSYLSDLYLNAPLYNAVKGFSTSPAANNLTGPQKKFLRETLVAFEINGMKLDENGKKALKVINDKIIDYGNQFDRNLAEHKDSVEFTAEDLTGVPAANMQPWKRANGKYMIRINGPNYISVMENAVSENTRKIFYLKYNNRAYPKNIAVLDSLLFYRQKLADRLGYRSYAEYALVTKMAAKPANVWNFLDDLQAKLAPHVTTELGEKNALKTQLHSENQDVLRAWDAQYYHVQMLNLKYGVNVEEVKQYFEMNNTLQGMFTVYQKLFNINIKEVKGLPVWDSKIKSYELWMDGRKMGTFFLDLFPRPNKYTHFETAPIAAYRIADGREILPVGALICNFPEGSAAQPSLLDHADVITMFHEFGHLIHFLVSHPVIASQGLGGIKGDFIEAPSQFLENFCWNYDCLKLFAKNYKTGEVLPVSLFNKMKAAQNLDVSFQYTRQVELAKIDFTYEDRYNNIKNTGLAQTEENLFGMMQIPYPTGAHFICGFNHLNSYGANYYGYLWSKVYAQDIFSLFEQHGVLDPFTGVKYRKDILEKGATEEESDMLRNFLGRQPNSQAFLKSLGLN